MKRIQKHVVDTCLCIPFASKIILISKTCRDVIDVSFEDARLQRCFSKYNLQPIKMTREVSKHAALIVFAFKRFGKVMLLPGCIAININMSSSDAVPNTCKKIKDCNKSTGNAVFISFYFLFADRPSGLDYTS